MAPYLEKSAQDALLPAQVVESESEVAEGGRSPRARMARWRWLVLCTILAAACCLAIGVSGKSRVPEVINVEAAQNKGPLSMAWPLVAPLLKAAGFGCVKKVGQAGVRTVGAGAVRAGVDPKLALRVAGGGAAVVGAAVEAAALKGELDSMGSGDEGSSNPPSQ